MTHRVRNVKHAAREAWPKAGMRRRVLAPFLALAAVLFATLPAARAHDPYESWAVATVRPEALELSITMAPSTALRVVDPEKSIRTFSAETFASHRAKFERAAGDLFLLTSGRKPLAARSCEASLTEENNVVFKLTYARPAAGLLLVRAAFLRQLGPGYGAIFDASDTAGNHLGWEQLSFENPDFQITLPDSAPTKKS